MLISVAGCEPPIVSRLDGMGAQGVAMFAVRNSHGVFRDHEDWVRVRDSAGREIDVTKDSYVASRRSPPFSALPLVEVFPQSSPLTGVSA